MLEKIKKLFIRYINRQEKFEQVAKELGLSYTKYDEYGLIEYMRDFRLFKEGDSKKITHILAKEKAEFYDPDIRVFDYSYETGSGDDSTTYSQTVFFMQSKDLALPQLYMEPEHFFHRVGKHLGFEDIDFEKHPTFSKQYWLKGEDEHLVRQTMNEEVIHFFTIEKDWYLEGLNYYLILYKKDLLLLPEEVKDLYTKGLQIVELVKQES